MAKAKKNNLNSFEGIFFGESNELLEEAKDTAILGSTDATDTTQAKPTKEAAKKDSIIKQERTVPSKTKQVKTPKEPPITKQSKKRGRPK